MLFKEKKRFPFKNYGLFFLNFTQFSVVLVDNIFKLIIAFFLIDLEGKESSSEILSSVGAVYVIPFLLLSSLGGSLADRYSKRTITICIKCLGGVIILTSLFIFHIKSISGAYVLLFLLATQSAIFGPSKYGMIPELVPQNQIAKANGYITSFTYLAIILGTFLAAFLSDIFDKNYIKVLLVTLLFSAAGITSSFLIPKKEVVRFNAPFNLGIFKETLSAIMSYPKKAHLGITIIAAAFFLLIGSFTQMAIIPFAILILNKTEFTGSYLFLITALGIALGAYVVGKMTQNRPQLVFPALGGLVLAIMMMALGLQATTVTSTVFYLLILGVAGGVYIVPIDAFIQMTATDQQRGRILGANNFLGFLGVLLAAALLKVMSQVLHLKLDQSFFYLGLGTLLFTFILIAKVSDRLLAFWFTLKGFKKRTWILLSPNIQVLVVPNFNYDTLAHLLTNKERVFMVTSRPSRSYLGAYLYCPPNADLADMINQNLDARTLILIEKNQLGLHEPKIKGQLETYEAIL